MHSHTCLLHGQIHQGWGRQNEKLPQPSNPPLPLKVQLIVLVNDFWMVSKLLFRQCCQFGQFFRLRNDLYCVEWGVKLYSLTHRLVSFLFAVLFCWGRGKRQFFYRRTLKTVYAIFTFWFSFFLGGGCRHSDPAPGLCPWTPLGDRSLARFPFRKFLDSPL